MIQHQGNNLIRLPCPTQLAQLEGLVIELQNSLHSSHQPLLLLLVITPLEWVLTRTHLDGRLGSTSNVISLKFNAESYTPTP